MKVGGFNRGRIIPVRTATRSSPSATRRCASSSTSARRPTSVPDAPPERRPRRDRDFENKLLELDGEVRQCIADAAAVAQTAAEELADVNKRTEEVQTAMGKADRLACMNGKKACDTKVHDMEGSPRTWRPARPSARRTCAGSQNVPGPHDQGRGHQAARE